MFMNDHGAGVIDEKKLKLSDKKLFFLFCKRLCKTTTISSHLNLQVSIRNEFFHHSAVFLRKLKNTNGWRKRNKTFSISLSHHIA
jgi:hypothetical protein